MAIVGIDLGTTNSACSVWKGGKPHLIPNRLGKSLTPSIVSADGEGVLSVGEVAKNRLVSHPSSTAAVFKRLMGTDQTMNLDRRAYSAVELSSMVLRSLKEDAQTYLGEDVTEAVISVPAYFNDQQRKATKLAAELAGLKVERLINEPTAAALVYGLQDCEDGSQFLILDLGGGTFDVSLVEYFDGMIEVHASSGDNFLGGENFLELLIADFLQSTGLEKKDLSKEEFQLVTRKVESAMHGLSTQHEAEIERLVQAQNEPWKISRDRFEKVVKVLLNRIKLPIERTIRDSGINLHEISEVILVGGATRIQCVRSLVSRMFRRLPRSEVDPDLVVAMGAGVQAGLREKQEDLNDVVLTDVAPYSLGTEVVNEGDTAGRHGGLFFPIIERNTIVPVSIERRLWTAQKGQTQIASRVYQGESRLVKNNILLGEMDVDVPKNDKEHEAIDVRYSYDMNGLLEVDITVVGTEQTYSLVIENSESALSESEIDAARKKLAKLKFHPRDAEENRLLVSRAERLFESSIGERRDAIGNALAHFEVVLERQDDREIDGTRKRFEEFLDELENESLF